MKKFASFLLCLLLFLGLGTGSAKSAGAEESTVGSAEDIWESYPSSEMFYNLWVGDIVIFKAHEYEDTVNDEGIVVPNGPGENESLTVLDGNCVEIDYFNRDGGFYAMGLKCVKPGTSTVKVSVEDENGNTGEKTFSFTVAERPENQPVTVSSEFPSEIRLKIGDDASFLDDYQVVFKISILVWRLMQKFYTILILQ